MMNPTASATARKGLNLFLERLDELRNDAVRLEEAVAAARGERWSDAMRFLEGELCRLWGDAHRLLVALENEYTAANHKESP